MVFLTKAPLYSTDVLKIIQMHNFPLETHLLSFTLEPANLQAYHVNRIIYGLKRRNSKGVNNVTAKLLKQGCYETTKVLTAEESRIAK